MERRSLLAAVLLLLIMPLVRFIEAWQRPELEAAIKGWKLYDASQVTITLDGVTLQGVVNCFVEARVFGTRRLIV